MTSLGCQWQDTSPSSRIRKITSTYLFLSLTLSHQYKNVTKITTANFFLGLPSRKFLVVKNEFQNFKFCGQHHCNPRKSFEFVCSIRSVWLQSSTNTCELMYIQLMNVKFVSIRYYTYIDIDCYGYLTIFSCFSTV